MYFGVELQKNKKARTNSQLCAGRGFLSYSSFMILLPEGTFYYNCAVMVAVIKEEKKKKEGNYIAYPAFYF